MDIDPMTAATIMSSLIGGKQLGAAAPAFQPGAASGVANIMPQFAQQNDFGQNVTPLSGLLPPTPSEVPVDTTADESMSDMAAQNNFGAGLQSEQPSGIGGLLSGAMDNLDANLARPSVGMGLGVLSSIDPRLAQGGLLASALFGKNKLF